MARLSTDLAANVASRAWTGFLGLVFPPVYAALMGVEGYGLVGLFTTLNALFVVLDLGWSRTVVREVASFRQGDDPTRVRDLVRTVEAFVWVIGAAFCAGMWVAAPWIARKWLGPSVVSAPETIASIRIMGLVCAISWPVTLYGQILLGLRRQMTTSVISAVAHTVRTVGAALVLWYGPRTVTAFFSWTLLVTVAWCVVVRRKVLTCAVEWNRGPARVCLSALTSQWRASAAIWLSSAAAVMITQIDRLIGSGVLALREFGYYSLAVAVAAGIQYLSLPVWNAVFPRMCRVAADREQARHFFRLAAQIMAVLVVPASLVLAMRADVVLLGWTGRSDVMANAAPFVGGLAVAATCNALAYMPLALLLARGDAFTAMRIHLLALAVAIPIAVVAGSRWGGVGLAWSVAAVAAVAFMGLALGAGVRESGPVLVDVASMGATVAGFQWLVGLATPTVDGRLEAVLYVCRDAVVALMGGVMMAPDVRRRLFCLVAGRSMGEASES